RPLLLPPALFPYPTLFRSDPSALSHTLGIGVRRHQHRSRGATAPSPAAHPPVAPRCSAADGEGRCLPPVASGPGQAKGRRLGWSRRPFGDWSVAAEAVDQRPRMALWFGRALFGSMPFGIGGRVLWVPSAARRLRTVSTSARLSLRGSFCTVGTTCFIVSCPSSLPPCRVWIGTLGRMRS